MAVETPICDFGWKAPDFSLLGVDGKSYSLADVKGENATLVVFMCNHCPYVLAVLDRLIRDVKDLQALGVGVVAINANDPIQYPADSFDNMKAMATEHHFPFPYLFDDSQDVARAYDAVCTPDFFGFDQNLGCNTVVDWTHRASKPVPKMPSASCLRPCHRSLKPVMAPRHKSHQWAVPSSGVRANKLQNRLSH